MRKIIGVTVGTPTSPSKIGEELKPVKTVNGVKPDKNGNVQVSTPTVDLSGKADKPLVVNATRNEDRTFTTDHSADEIKTFVSAGGDSKIILDGALELPYFSFDENAVYYCLDTVDEYGVSRNMLRVAGNIATISEHVYNPANDGYVKSSDVYSRTELDVKFKSQSEAIEEKLDADKLPEAINTALAQAKESGDFKGDPGEPGQPGAPGGDYVLTEADKNEIAEIAAGMVDVPEGGDGGETGFELVKEFRTEEEVEEFTVALDTELDESYLVVFRFNGTVSNAQKYKPVVYVNGAPYRYLDGEMLYNSGINTFWSCGEIKGVPLKIEMHPKSFLYNNGTDDFTSLNYMGQAGGQAYQVRAFAHTAMPLKKIGARGGGGVFGIGTTVRIYKIKGV